MYISGNISDFENRMHQLGTDQSIMTSFITEGTSYLTALSIPQLSGRWEREASRRQMILVPSGTGYLAKQFGVITIKFYTGYFLASTGYRISGFSATGYEVTRNTATDIDSTELGAGQYFDSINYASVRTFLKFNTSSIGSTKNVVSAKLTMTPSDMSNVATNFNVIVTDYNWSGQDPLNSGNMQNAYTGCASATTDIIFANTSGLGLNTPYSGMALSTGWINKTGYTYYGIQSENTINDITPTGFEYLTFHPPSNVVSGYRPMLTVVYSG